MQHKKFNTFDLLSNIGGTAYRSAHVSPRHPRPLTSGLSQLFEECTASMNMWS